MKKELRVKGWRCLWRDRRATVLGVGAVRRIHFILGRKAATVAGCAVAIVQLHINVFAHVEEKLRVSVSGQAWWLGKQLSTLTNSMPLIVRRENMDPKLPLRIRTLSRMNRNKSLSERIIGSLS